MGQGLKGVDLMILGKRKKTAKAIKKRSNKRGKRPTLSKSKALFYPIVKVVFTMAVVSMLTFGGWRLYSEVVTTSYLEVGLIEIEGSDKVPDADVVELSGIERGINILNIDTSAAETLLKTHPFIEDASVKRILPDTIGIELVERVPVAIVSAEGLYAMDSKGVLFKEYSFTDALDLPVITGPDNESNEWFEELKSGVLELLTILDSGVSRLKVSGLSEIHGDPYYGFTLVTIENGVKIDIGNSDFKEKLSKLNKVLEIRDGFSGLEFIYLNSDRGVVVRVAASLVKGERGVS